MKKILKIITALSLLLSINSYAYYSATKPKNPRSTVKFYELINQHKTNKYGERLFKQDISISSWVTTHMFWSTFNDPNTRYITDLVRSRVTIEIIAKSDNLCSLKKLKGCSSQNALVIDDFLVQDNMSIMVTDNPLVDGIHPMRLPRGNFSNSESIDESFGKLLSTTESYLEQFNYADRTAYLHNTMVGLEKPIEIAKNQKIDFLQYNYEVPEEIKSKCSFGRFRVNDFFCRSSAGMFIDAWVPLIHFDNSYKVEPKPDLIVDTEYSILALQGTKLKRDNVINDYRNHGGLLREIFMPMISMFNVMKSFMFGNDDTDTKGTSIVQVDYDFTEKPLTYSFFTTNDKNTISGRIDTKIVGLHSVYGSKMTMCKVDYKTRFFFFPVTKKYTFIKGQEAPTNRLYIPKSAYDLLPDDQRGKTFKMFKGFVYYTKMDTDSWLDYCQANNHKDGDLGFFGYALERISENHLYAVSPITYMLAFGRSFFDLFRDEYRVKEVQQEIKRGLILDLEKIPEDENTDKIRENFHFEVGHILRVR